MRDTLRPLSQSERDEAIKVVYDFVSSRLGEGYLWNLLKVVETTVLYAVTFDAQDPGPALNYWDRKVRVVSEMVAHFLSCEYQGISQFGLLERCRYLYSLAHSNP